MEHTSALEIVTIVVAGYAAIVGTLALVFQIVSWLRSWATRVEVKLGPFEVGDLSGPGEPVVLFRMINHSEHPVKITSVGFAPQTKGGPGAVILKPFPLNQPLPIPIPARDQAQVWTLPDKKPAFLDPAGTVRAEISTSDGKSFRSKPVPVASLFDEAPTAGV